jgi:hypothetical protein
MLFIFSSISQEKRSLHNLTHFSTEFTKIQFTFSNLLFNGDKLITCISKPGLRLTSRRRGHKFSSKTISHHKKFILVCFDTLTANFNISSQKGSFIDLTSHISGMAFINFHHFEVKVSFQVHISIQAQQAQA